MIRRTRHQSAFSNMRKKSCKTGLLYEKVGHYDLISSFSKMTKVRASKDLLKVKMAGSDSTLLSLFGLSDLRTTSSIGCWTGVSAGSSLPPFLLL